MNKEEIIEIIRKIKETSKKRRFVQTWDLIVNLKNYDLRKPENRILDFFYLPKGRGKKIEICSIVGPELEKDAKEVFDFVILKDELPEISENKRYAKKIARRYEFFVAQADLMPLVGRYLGKYLGPRDKMPNPKINAIISPKVDKRFLKNLYDKLQNTVRVSIKKHITFGVPVGSENMKEEDVAENIIAFYEWLLGKLPLGKQNIDSIYLKLTMSEAYRIL